MLKSYRRLHKGNEEFLDKSIKIIFWVFLDLFIAIYVYEYFAYRFICIPHVFLVPMEVISEKSIRSPRPRVMDAHSLPRGC